MNLLHTLGLMTRKEHEAWTRAITSSHDHWLSTANNLTADLQAERERFKRAATDLAAQAEEIAAQKGLVAALTEKNVELVGRIETLKGYHRRDTEEIAALRPDALAMRRKRAMDRDRAAGKGGRSSKGNRQKPTHSVGVEGGRAPNGNHPETSQAQP